MRKPIRLRYRASVERPTAMCNALNRCPSSSSVASGRAATSATELSCLDGALLASRFLSLMLMRGGLTGPSPLGSPNPAPGFFLIDRTLCSSFSTGGEIGAILCFVKH